MLRGSWRTGQKSKWGWPRDSTNGCVREEGEAAITGSRPEPEKGWVDWGDFGLKAPFDNLTPERATTLRLAEVNLFFRPHYIRFFLDPKKPIINYFMHIINHLEH